MSAASSREALIKRLPATMAASMNEQLARASLLFPAELRMLNRRLDWLEHLDRADFDRLFAAMNGIESRLQLPVSLRREARLSIEYTAMIARSPLYPDWRREAERVFATIDEGAGKQRPEPEFPRLLICVLPAGLPLSQELWPDPPPDTVRVTLEQDFREVQPGLLAAIAGRECPPELAPIERTWVAAAGESLPFSGLPSTTVIGWDDVAALRRMFLDRLNSIARSLQSVDEAMADLERADLGPFLPPRLKADPLVREFIRTLLLSGNGSLVLNNSFAQWCASEALRRAQPQALVAAFGVRDKPKPFSSLVWFEDQARANPMPEQPDPAGSLVDCELLSSYVYLTACRLAPYRGRTLAWFTVADRKSALVAAPGGALSRTDRPLSAGELRDICLHWLK